MLTFCSIAYFLLKIRLMFNAQFHQIYALMYVTILLITNSKDLYHFQIYFAIMKINFALMKIDFHKCKIDLKMVYSLLYNHVAHSLT